MEADWDEVARIVLPPPGPQALPTPATTLAFDTSQELLWAGNEYGRVTSFHGAELQKYTSYRGHAVNEGPVKQLLFCEKGVISLSGQSIHLSSRRGLTQWNLIHDAFTDLRCMSYTSKGTHEILVAGNQDTMFKVDVKKGIVTQTVSAEANYTIMKRGGLYICAATSTGSVHLLDPNTLKVVKDWQAHLGWINDMDAKSDYLVTCGFSPRQQHGYLFDPFAKVFDLKILTTLPPIPFASGAAFVRMHPRMSTTCIVASQNGQVQVVDIMNPNMISLKQINIFDTYLTSLELAPSGEAVAMTDGQCSIHLWGSPTRLQFTEYSSATEFADTVAPAPLMDWSLDTPLSSIGMPYYRETLLSAWPSYMTFEVGAPPVKIDSTILSSLKRADIGGWAANPRKMRRNQVQDTRSVQRAQDSFAAPKFLSEKAREDPSAGGEERRMSDALAAINDMMLEGSTKRDVPVMYRNVEIKYSKFGVDDFDFEYYNKTVFSGLETHIANSYANPLLQLLKFTPLIRNLALLHTATNCLFENCLLCELGFLFDMLEKAEGQNCQATNFLKTFSSLSHAASLGLLEEHSPNSPLTVMIQSVNRFLLDKIVADFRQMSQQSHMDHALTTSAVATVRCAHCTNEMICPKSTYVHDLIYPPKTGKSSLRAPRPSFSQTLKASVERQEQTRGWCDRCKRYQQLATRKSIQSVPAVLTLNAAIHSLEARQLWATPNWLPKEIGIIVDQGQFYCYEGQDLQFHLQKCIYNIMVYELVGIVADINSGENQKPHLVSLINVGPSSRDPNAESQWHLFNDFLVRATTQEEALRFEPSWKLPSILTYQVKTHSHNIDDSWKENLDPSLLYRRYSTTQGNPHTFRYLSHTTEAPRPGTHVAIDAEFVALQREEIEVKADGTRETVRPSRLGLARVSVLRGSGPDQGLPFIDDYIAISEPVVDYLTAFSGISPGDLDRATSRHALVSLKVAYKKLWLLLNLGCIFIGHGLPKDFRTINIHVPRAQVIDTVDLFFIRARQRRLSLRFLAWYLLKEDIQAEEKHGHDSIEDARTALRLWRKYEEFVDAGILESMLNEIYAKGREMQFKAPSAAREGADRPGTPGSSAPSTPARTPLR
ncbi:PAB-dependent poly(A)-specific ribonuclease subunit PAN2 [Cryomyces antarcticus]